jgi:hypothetical protein
MSELAKILITVKPSSHRDMVKDALTRAGWTVSGSGYDHVNNMGYLECHLPQGARAGEFYQAWVDCNLPFGPKGPVPRDQLPADNPLPGPRPEAEPPPPPPNPRREPNHPP